MHAIDHRAGVLLLCALASFGPGCGSHTERQAPSSVFALLEQAARRAGWKEQAGQNLGTCLQRVAWRAPCSLAERQALSLPLSVDMEEGYASRPGAQRRIQQTLTCVNALFAKAGVTWRMESTSIRGPRFRSSNLPALLTQLEHDRPPRPGARLWFVLGDERVFHSWLGGTVAITRGSTAVVTSWPRLENDCLATARSLAFMLGATTVDVYDVGGVRMVMSPKLERFSLPAPDPVARISSTFSLDAENVAKMRVTRFALAGRDAVSPTCHTHVEGATECYAMAAEEARTGRRRVELAALEFVSSTSDACAAQHRVAQETSSGDRRRALAEARGLGAVLQVMEARGSGPSTALDNCRDRTSRHLLRLADRWAGELEQAKDRRAGEAASLLFEEHLRLFPRGPRVFAVAYKLALVLEALSKHARAFDRYYQVIQLRPDEEVYVAAVAGAMRTGWSEYQRGLAATVLKLRSSEEELPARQKRLVEVFTLATRSPRLARTRALFFEFAIASIYDSNGRFDESNPRFAQVALREPRLDIADLAARSLVNGLLKARRYDELIAWVKRLRQEARLQRGDFAVWLTEYEREAKLLQLGRSPGSADTMSIDLAACQGGDLRACNDVGVRYQRGAGVRRDLALAVKLFKMACDRRETRRNARGKLLDVRGWQGCSNLAGAYLAGEGVRRDVRRALALARLACREADHCNTLGAMYLTGRGVARDPREAARLFVRACAVGLPEACTNAGNVALNTLQPPDHRLALQMLGRGCELDQAEACRILSTMYSRGSGVAKDMARWGVFFARACRLGLSAKYQSICDSLLKRFPTLGKERPQRSE